MMFHTDRENQQWDLDDPETYVKSWFPDEYVEMDGHELRKCVQNKIGWSLFYMICAHPRFGRKCGQYARVVEFGKHFARESREPDRWENVPWLRKQLFLFLDETENQC